MTSDPAHRGDLVEPGEVTVSYTIERPSGESSGGVGCNSSCGPGPAYVVLDLSASDDRTATADLGYKLEVVGGTLPREMFVDDSLPWRVDPFSPNGRELGIGFDRDDHGFSFELQITAVDLNGNEGPPVVVTIEG